MQFVGHWQVGNGLFEERHGIGRAALLRQRAGGGAQCVGRQHGAIGTQRVVQREGVGGTAALQQRQHAVRLQPHAQRAPGVDVRRGGLRERDIDPGQRSALVGQHLV